MYFDLVLDGPSGLSSCEAQVFSVLLPGWETIRTDDDLTEAEMYTLMGTYVCDTGNAFLGCELSFTHILLRIC